MALNKFDIFCAAVEVENAKRAKISRDEYDINVTTAVTTVTRKRDSAQKEFYIKTSTLLGMETFMANLTGAQLSDMFVDYDKMMKKLAKDKK